MTRSRSSVLILILLLAALPLGCGPAVPTATADAPTFTGSGWFAEADAGLDFVHDAGPTDGAYFMPQIVGSGAALFDFDGDGRLDVLLLQNGGLDSHSKNKLYQQLPDGRWRSSTWRLPASIPRRIGSSKSATSLSGRVARRGGDTRTVGREDLRLMTPAAVPAKEATVGSAVWAQWTPNGWYHGKADKTCPVGLHVAYDDGDQADRPYALVAVDRAPRKGDVNVGTHLLAMWTDGRVYPGTVTQIADDKYDIQYDDGDTRTVGREDLRLLP